MAVMTKRVNINAPVAIRNIKPPIYGTCKNVIMSTGDILKCLCKRAVVDEILPDGSTIRLTMKNYYTDNGAGLDASKVIVKNDNTVINNIEEIPTVQLGTLCTDNDDSTPVFTTTVAETVICEDDNTSDETTSNISLAEENNTEEATNNDTEETLKEPEADVMDSVVNVETATEEVAIATEDVSNIDETIATEPADPSTENDTNEQVEKKSTTKKKTNSNSNGKKKTSNK